MTTMQKVDKKILKYLEWEKKSPKKAESFREEGLAILLGAGMISID